MTTIKNNYTSVRNALLAYSIGVTAVLASSAGVLGAMVIDKYAFQRTEAVHVPVSQPAPRVFDSAYSDSVGDVMDQCYLALAEVESSMTEEEAERIPAEVWRGAYQRCLIDHDATM